MHYLGITSPFSAHCIPRRSISTPVSARPPDSVQARLDIQALDRAVEHYFWNGLAPSTQKMYSSAKKCYLQFCKDKSLSPLPAPEQQLCQFVSSLAIQSLCHNTIKSYLAAIRHLHIAEGYGDPHINTMARLEQVLKGIKIVQSKGPKKRERLPITPNHLAKLKEVWSSGLSKFDGQMLFAAASLYVFLDLCGRENSLSPRPHPMTRGLTSASTM